jgi:hypothetical protein
MDVPISLAQFTQIVASDMHKITADEVTQTVSVKKISWQNKVVAFLQNIPLINKFISSPQADIVTQAIFLKAVTAVYGENMASTVASKYKLHFVKHDKGPQHVKPLTAYTVKTIVKFAEDVSARALQLRYPGIGKEMLKGHVKAWDRTPWLWKTLTLNEYVAIRVYTGGHYRQTNAALREGDPKVLASWQNLINDATIGLDKLAKNGYSYEKLLMRGTSIAKDNKFVSIDDYQEGKVVADKAFVSTTQNKSTAKNFSATSPSRSTDDQLMLHLFVGQAGAQIDSVSIFKKEKEVLVKPGTEFSVLFNAFDKKTNVYKVVMTNTNLPATHGSKGYVDALVDPQPKKAAESERASPWLDLA